MTGPGDFARSQQAGVDALILVALEQAAAVQETRPPPTLPLPRYDPADQGAVLEEEIAEYGVTGSKRASQPVQGREAQDST